MNTSMTAEERALRVCLDESVCDLRALLARCPWIDDLDRLDRDTVEDAAAIADQVNDLLREAEGFTDTLAQLSNLSHEAVSLVATSRCALGVVREVLTVLTAAIDHRLAA